MKYTQMRSRACVHNSPRPSSSTYYNLTNLNQKDDDNALRIKYR